MSQFQLSKRQEATVAVAITLVCAVIILCFIGALLWLFGALINRFSSILLPLGVAGVVALILKPYQQMIANRIGGRPLLAVFLVYATILIPVTVFGVLFGAKILTEAAEFASNIPKWSHALQIRLQEHLPAVQTFWEEHNLANKLKDAINQHGTQIIRSMSNMTGLAVEAWGSVFKSAAGMLSWFVLPIYLGFFLLGRPITKQRFEDLMPFLKPSTRRDVSYLAFEFVEILVSFFRGQISIAFAQGILFAIGFVLIGLDYGFTLGLSLGFLNVIPYLGSMVGLGIALPLALFQDEGGILLVGFVLVVFTLVQCIEGYYLTPKIMGDRTGLHPLAIIIAIFFWGSVFGGITGMILAIPLTAFLVVFWRLIKTKYMAELM